jgi:hypothetical protein
MSEDRFTAPVLVSVCVDPDRPLPTYTERIECWNLVWPCCHVVMLSCIDRACDMVDWFGRTRSQRNTSLLLGSIGRFNQHVALRGAHQLTDSCSIELPLS